MTGLIAFRKGWIDQLHVLPVAQGQRLGTSLLKTRRTPLIVFSSGRFSAMRTRGAFTKPAVLHWP
jgi:hypothetical protein